MSSELSQDIWEKLMSTHKTLSQLDLDREVATRRLFEEYEQKKRPTYIERNKIFSQIPKFWITSLENCDDFCEHMSVKDYEVMEYLREIDVEMFKDGRKVIFYFNENPYFKNSALTMSVETDNDKDGEGESESEPKIKGTQIEWKEGKNYTKSKENGSSSNKKVKVEPSIFDFFEEGSFEITMLISDEFYPDALKYFEDVRFISIFIYIFLIPCSLFLGK